MALSRIQTAEIADNAITTAKVDDATVIGTDIVDGTITNAMVASGAAIAHTKCAVGPVASLNVGTGANQILQLNGSGVLPVLDGTALTGIVSDFTPLENQLARLGLHLGAVEQLAKFNMIDQVVDDYEDATGVTAYNGVAEIPGHTAHTLTANTTPNASTTQKKFGTHSIYFDGNAEWLSPPAHEDFNLGTGDFCIEAWIRRDNLDNDECIWGDGDAEAASNMQFYFTASGNMRMVNPTSGNGAHLFLTTGTTISIGNWHHVAAVRYGDTFHIYIDGTSRGNSSVAGLSFGSSTKVHRLGHAYGTQYYGFTGYIDEFRLSKGTARYTANFTPSTSAFTADQYTKLLVHGDGNFNDSSGTAATPAVANTGSSSSATVGGSAGAKYYSGTSPSNKIIADSSKWTGASWVFPNGDDVDPSTGETNVVSTTTFSGDFIIQVTVTSDTSNSACWGMYRVSDQGSYNVNEAQGGMGGMPKSWWWQAGAGDKFKYQNSVQATHQYVDGSVIQIKRVGGAISFYDDGVLAHTFSQESTDDMYFLLGSGGGGVHTGIYWADISWEVGTTSFTTASYNNQTLLSTTTTAQSTATKASIVLQTEDELGTATINTDVKAGVSRDALNYVDTTLAKIGTWGSGNVYAANDVTIPGTVMTKIVTVAASKLVTDGTSQATLTLTEGYTYKFDTSDSTLSGHTFSFATAADAAGSTQYTTGVTTSGTPGSANAYTQIVVAGSAPTLYYYCSNHASMGGTANTPAEAATTSMRYRVDTKNQSYVETDIIQGYDGGVGVAGTANGYASGGGGGAGGAGIDGTASSNFGNGGVGRTSSIDGTATFRGGGGGGGAYSGPASVGGNGGGGAGAGQTGTGTVGTANTGGGGGGSGRAAGGHGGSGIVIIRALTSETSGSTGNWNTTGTDGSHTWYKWTTVTTGGTFTPSQSASYEYLVIAGGGAGWGPQGGGGGAGGYLTGTLTVASAVTGITVGAGALHITHPAIPIVGDNSVFSTITSLGGGGGAGGTGGLNTKPAKDGGSGGGGAGDSTTGNNPDTVPGKGTTTTDISGKITRIHGTSLAWK